MKSNVPSRPLYPPGIESTSLAAPSPPMIFLTAPASWNAFTLSGKACKSPWHLTQHFFRITCTRKKILGCISTLCQCSNTHCQRCTTNCVTHRNISRTGNPGICRCRICQSCCSSIRKARTETSIPFILSQHPLGLIPLGHACSRQRSGQ